MTDARLLPPLLPRFGYGVGGEYPLASASAAERSAVDPEHQKRRGEAVVLVFSNQGLGTMVGATMTDWTTKGHNYKENFS